jgi:hypothetical protein
VLLVVVSPATAAPYWSDVAHATGGFVAPTGARSTGPALDQVSTLLRDRYLLTIPAPRQLPAQASVRVDTGAGALTADAVVPAAAVPAVAATPTGDRDRRPWWINGVLWLTVVLGALALFAGVALIRARRETRWQ